MKILLSIQAIFLVFCSYESLTTAEDFECDIDNGAAELELRCPINTQLFRGIGSRFPFFSDAIGSTCAAFDATQYFDEVVPVTYSSEDGGLTLSAVCPEENQVIVKLNMCVADAHVQVVTLHCSEMKNTIKDKYNATSDDSHVRVMCEEDSGVQGVYFINAGDDVVTRVVLACIRIQQEE